MGGEGGGLGFRVYHVLHGAAGGRGGDGVQDLASALSLSRPHEGWGQMSDRVDLGTSRTPESNTLTLITPRS